jgi:hypothetical protein
MKQFNNGKQRFNAQLSKQLIILLLFFISAYIFSLKVIPLIREYYKLKFNIAGKSKAEKLLKTRLSHFKKIKFVRFESGNHRFSTNLLTLLSYIKYLRQSGYDIKVKIKDNNFKNKKPDKNIILNVPKFRKNTLDNPASANLNKTAETDGAGLRVKSIIIALDKISNIGIVFSLLRTFKAFPVELNKISINSNSEKNFNAVINIQLIGFKK